MQVTRVKKMSNFIRVLNSSVYWRQNKEKPTQNAKRLRFGRNFCFKDLLVCNIPSLPTYHFLFSFSVHRFHNSNAIRTNQVNIYFAGPDAKFKNPSGSLKRNSQLKEIETKQITVYVIFYRTTRSCVRHAFMEPGTIHRNGHSFFKKFNNV